MTESSALIPAPRARETYHRLVQIKRLLPRWLLRRLDPYNSEADAFIERAAAEVAPGAVVVDAGAGECRHAPLFAHACYLGTDSATGEAQAWDYSQLAFVSDLCRLPLRSSGSDVVVSVNVLEHVREPQSVLREMARVLKPGGRLYLVAPQAWQVHQAPEDYLRFTRYGLEHLLAGAEFVVEKLEPVGGTFWNMSYRSLYLLTHFRGLALPLGILLSPLLGFAIPLACFYLDALDRDKHDTLGYTVVARKA